MSKELSKFLGVKYTDQESVIVKDENGIEHTYFVSFRKGNFVVVGDKELKVIKKNAFKNVEKQEFMLFTDKVRVLEESAFENCKDLRFVEFSSENEGKKMPEALIENSEKKEIIDDEIFVVQLNCFRNCSELDCVIFPKVKTLKIENNAFSCCNKLRVIKIDCENIEFSPEAFFGVSELEICAPKNCKGLASYAREHDIKICPLT